MRFRLCCNRNLNYCYLTHVCPSRHFCLQCALCRNPITDLKEAELDHRVPLSKGGSDDPSNLQLAHRACNRTKGAKME